MSRIAQIWALLRSSLWFIPSVIAVASMAAAFAAVSLSGQTERLAQALPRLFGVSAEGSRQMLAAIATSMITTAGVVLSITIVALAQASSQYSPRVLRNFMRDVPTQLVLGSFVGSFAYCIIVLRAIRGGESAFVPSLAVFGGIAYSFVAIGFLIYFIHHVAQSIQASSIVSRIFQETLQAIERLHGDSQHAHTAGDLPHEWTWVDATKDGYIIATDTGKLLELARSSGRAVRLSAPIGDFVAAGRPIVALQGAGPVPGDCVDALRGAVRIARQRSIEQDAAFGLQQLVDVAVKALSPGINDPSTACLCIDRLGSLMARLAGTEDLPERTSEEGRLLLVAPARGFAGLLHLAFAPVVHHSRGDLQVLARLLHALERVREANRQPSRARELAQIARSVERAAHQVRSPQAAEVRRHARRLSNACRAG